MLLESYVNSCCVKMLSICYKWFESYFCGGLKELSIKDVHAFVKKNLHKLEKVERVGKNGLELVKMHIFTFGT